MEVVVWTSLGVVALILMFAGWCAVVTAKLLDQEEEQEHES
jgi:hypothetical protein